MFLNAAEIIQLAQKGMITPFATEKTRKVDGRDVLSFGPEGYGYTVRLSPENIMVCYTKAEVDPKNVTEEQYRPVTFAPDAPVKSFLLPAGTYALAQTVEEFDLPDDVGFIAWGKSSYSRVGVIAGGEPAEPGWKGVYTLRISNTSPAPVRIYAGEGICQFMFYRGEMTAPYEGKYQKTKKTALAKI